MASRDYSEVTKKALFALSRGQCYEPHCSEHVVQMAGDTPIVKVEIAHIRAAKKNGPRYDEDMSEQARKSFPNLLLLCVFHHKLVDRKPTGDNYSVECLQEWKMQREGELSHDLSTLTEDDLTEALGATLQEIIGETKDELLAAITKVEDVSHESAQLLRTLVTETFDRPYLDADAIASLAETARVFNNLPDYAPMLLESSRGLDHLPDYAPMLNESSRSLNYLPDYVSILREATQGLLNLPDYAPILLESSRGLNNIPDYEPIIRSACRDLENIVDQLGQTIHEAKNMESSEYFSKLDTSTQSASSVSYELAENIENLERAANLALSATTARPLDRWTYIRNGLLAGAILGAILVAGIWYWAAHASP